MNHAMTLAALLGAFAQDLPGLPGPAEPRRKRSTITTEAKTAARRRRQMERIAAKKQEASNG